MNSTSFFTDRMHLTEEGVALYVDALKLQRTSALPKIMLKHVEHCPDCQLQIVEVHEMMKNEVYDASMKHPYFDTIVHEPAVRYGTSLFRIAAVITGAALLGFGYYFASNSNTFRTPPAVVQQEMPQQEQTKVPAQESTVKEKEQLLADNFSESLNMEDLVQTQFRSISVEVITPDVGEVVQQPIEFKWEDVGEPLSLKILSNKERTLISAQVTTNSYTAQKKFAPGLYYWKLETKDELIFVGKFLVR
ncbi:MAG: hypothetical protein HYV29_07215 [Ignavibacteriales bacterium]|nr:hypothetical protein [Ignavibacteriales bacterium]